MTPAIKFLKNCIHFGFSQPSQEVLQGFLWASPGQRAAITGFINFLRNSYGNKITLDSIPKTVTLERPYLSTKMLKQRFIDILRESKEREIPDERLLRTSIAYLHGVEIPEFVRLSRNEILKDKAGVYYLRLANENFYLIQELKAEKML